MIALDKRGAPASGEHARASQTGPRAAALASRDLDIPYGWRVEPGSPRPGALAPTAVPPNRMALHIELGPGGRGPLLVGRALPGPRPAQAVCLRCYGLTAGDAPLSLSLALTAGHGNPWLAQAAVPVPLQRHVTLSFDLRGLVPEVPEVPEAPEAGVEVERIVFGISTTAQAGFVVLERVVIW